LEHARIIGRIDDGGDAAVVLRRGAQHRLAADVDVLHRILERTLGIGDRRFERIEVHHQELNGLNARAVEGCAMLRVVRAREKPGMDARMQGLHTPIEHLGKAGIGGYLGDAEALAREELRGAAGGKELEARGAQAAGELDDAGLVRDADQRPADGGHYPLIRSCCIFLRSVLRLMPSICAASDWLPSAWPSTVSIIGFSMFFST